MGKIIIQIIVVGILLPCHCFAQKRSEFERIAIKNIKIYKSPFTEPINDGAVLIEDGIIKIVGSTKDVLIPKDIKVIDAKGLVMTSGFWNSHVHLIEPIWANAANQSADSLSYYLKNMLTSYGFAYAFDLAQLDFQNLNNLRRRINSGEVKGPTILAVGVPFTSKSPYYVKPIVLPELSHIDEVKKHISEQITNGANGIKLWSASPTGSHIDYMQGELIQVASELTAQHGMPLFAHPSNLKGALIAIKNGVTVLVHVAPDDRLPWDSIMMQTLISKNVALIPTLKLYSWGLKMEGINQPENSLITTSINQLADFVNAGGLVIFGTDVGYMTDYNPTEEYVLMEKAGMNFKQILASLTINPANRFGHQNRTGRIEPGLDADLVILEADPEEDVRNFAKVVYTIRKGKIIFNKR
jgi:imidazolonepropionase-like amidohydrolase